MVLRQDKVFICVFGDFYLQWLSVEGLAVCKNLGEKEEWYFSYNIGLYCT